MNITIRDAYENNLKHIDISLPKNRLIAFTGVSGSGKSTLALDTIQRECQRLYMESLGMTLNIGSKAAVGSIEGLSPAISITQHQSNNNPRSTVGTITEITSYLRILFANAGHPGFPGITPDHFSYNKPAGACSVCAGIGLVYNVNVDMLIDKEKSIRNFAIYGWDQVFIDRYGASLTAAAKHFGFTIDTTASIKEYDPVQMDLLLYGVMSEQFISHFPDITPPKTVPSGRFEGIVTNIMRRYSQADIKPQQKRKLEKFFTQQTCPSCHGSKWNQQSLSVFISNENIETVLHKSLYEMQTWIAALPEQLSGPELELTADLLDTISQKITSLVDIGLGYLTLDQTAGTLSSGEWQRIKLTSVIKSGLTGVLYVLDEPSAGLHPCDIPKILTMLQTLKELGNTVLIIEHNIDLIKAADHIVDFGPGAGRHGGTIVAAGSPQDIMNCKNSLTGHYLRSSHIAAIHKFRSPSNYLTVKNAHANNLKNLTLELPLNCFVTITGVSGSGKTSLIFHEVAEHAKAFFKDHKSNISESIEGLEHLDDVITLNHASVGRSSRSSIATYTDLFNDIRTAFAQCSREQGLSFTAREFSTNTIGGRCEECQGNAVLSIPMQFLPDVEITCPSCQGRRYKNEILAVTYNDHSISDILSMDIDSALEVFATHPNLRMRLAILQEIGLGYLKLGQATSTLSGGEAQRLKLASELMKQGKSRKLYLFDEPTTGLHLHDVLRVIRLFDRLIEEGNSVIVIEHNPHVITHSDYVIDIGPGGGKDGGTIVAAGTPQDIMHCEQSLTGRYLRTVTE